MTATPVSTFRLTALLVAAVVCCGCRKPAPAVPPRASGPLEHRVYVWQRDWSPAVKTAVTEHAGEFAGVAVLGAQLSWKDGREEMEGVRPRIDWAVTGAASRMVTAVIRLENPVPADAARLKQSVVDEARRLIAAARDAGASLAAVQIDFDSPQRRLADYTAWLHLVERELEPLPVQITTLASWLDAPAFAGLIAACDGYVLQVHSFDPPAPGMRAVVCDPVRARSWVERAAVLGRPFTVALPTYRTTAGYDAQGRQVGVATDGPVPAWPAGTRREEFPSDPAAMASLVAVWQRDRPAQLLGVSWYRLPVSTDTRNWRWPALAAVMSGRAPLSRLEVKMTGGAPLDVVLSNTGEQDEWLPANITLTWPGPPPAAGDGVAGWTLTAEAGRAVFTPSTPAARLLPAGSTSALGWLRFHEPAPPLPDIRSSVASAAGPAVRDR